MEVWINGPYTSSQNACPKMYTDSVTKSVSGGLTDSVCGVVV